MRAGTEGESSRAEYVLAAKFNAARNRFRGGSSGAASSYDWLYSMPKGSSRISSRVSTYSVGGEGGRATGDIRRCSMDGAGDCLVGGAGRHSSASFLLLWSWTTEGDSTIVVKSISTEDCADRGEG